MAATGPGSTPAGGGAAGAALEARGIVKRYGRQPALRGVDFEAHPGELLAVIGPNGAGKTTLLSILAGIIRADEGEVHLPRGEVGWVPQQAALYRRLTVEENLRLFARLERRTRRRGERRADARAERARATAATTRSLRLSGGNQQRINIAIGLLAQPVVLLLDEPSAGLDPRQRARLWEFVAALAGGGTTVIFSTHNIQEAERYGQRLLVIADGERLFDGSQDELRAAVRREAPEAAGAGLRDRLRRLPAPPGPLMRWLLLKDLQILRRSPAAGGAAGRLSGADRAAGRLRDLARARQAAGRLPQPGARRTRRSRSAPRRSTSSAPATRSASGSSASGFRTASRRSRRCESGDVLGALILPPRPGHQAAVAFGAEPRAADGAGDRQPGGPGQGATGRRPHHRAAQRGEPEDRPRGGAGLDPLPRPDPATAASSSLLGQPRSRFSASPTPSRSCARCAPRSAPASGGLPSTG